MLKDSKSQSTFQNLPLSGLSMAMLGYKDQELRDPSSNTDDHIDVIKQSTCIDSNV